MSNYIATFNTLPALPLLKAEDKLIIVANADEFVKVSELEKIFNLKEFLKSNFELSTYQEDNELILAVSAPLFKDVEAEFLLADSQLPIPTMFKNRLSLLEAKNEKSFSDEVDFDKLSKQASSLRKLSKTNKETDRQKVETKKIQPLVEEAAKQAEKNEEALVKTNESTPSETKTIKPRRGRRRKNEEITFVSSSATKKAIENEVVDHTSEKNKKIVEAIDLGKHLQELLQLKAEDYDFPASDDVFHLSIARLFEKYSSQNELKAAILSLDCGEAVWEKVEPYVDEIRELIKAE
jgi:hypothetical protein